MGSIFSKPDPPQPPDPLITAGAQTGSNVSTAVANAFLNNTNQVTPLGSLTYDPTSTYSFSDPSTGATYNIPRFTATQELGPVQQQTQDQQEQAKYRLAALANTQGTRLGELLNDNIDLSGAPARADSFSYPGAPQFGLGDAGAIQYGFGDAGPITRSYGPTDNFSADRARVEKAMFERLSPQLQTEQQRVDQRLADQGIRIGGQAYSAAQDVYARMANDARLGVIERGGVEQERLNNMAAQQAGFQNAAQQQEYLQNQGRGQFWNAAQQQKYGQNLGAGQFWNAAIQQYSTDAERRAAFANTARQNYLTEQYALRNQPINEVTALLSGSQVHQPSFMQTPSSQIPTTDIAGLINANFNQQQGNYNTAMTQQNQIIGGLFGAAGNIGAGFARSDERVKKNIHRIGTVFVAEPQPVEEPGKKKLPVYEYAYKDDPLNTRHVGPMAQDVEKYDPGAVRSIGGVKHIDPQRVMGSILKAA